MKKTFFIIALGLLLLSAGEALSQGPPPIITHPDQLVGLLSSILGYVWTILGILVVLMFLYAGFMFITAAGNDDKISQARKMVMWSIVGIVVMLMAGGVMLLLENFLRGA